MKTTTALHPLQELREYTGGFVDRCRTMGWLRPLAHVTVTKDITADAVTKHVGDSIEIATRAKSAEFADSAAMRRIQMAQIRIGCARLKLEKALEGGIGAEDTPVIRAAFDELKLATDELEAAYSHVVASLSFDRSVHAFASKAVDAFYPAGAS